MKKSIIALCTALILIGGCMTSTVSAATTQAAQVGKITVSGQGVIKVTPDVAYVTLGVQTRDTDAKKAQEQNSAAMTLVIAAIKSMGVEDKNIKTSNYYMYQEYDYSDSKERVAGYSVSNSVTVTVTDVSATGKIIDAGVAAGANSANNIQFGIADSSAYYAQALQLAVANAKEKSAAIAAALGVTVGNPVEVNESSGYYTSVMTEAAVNVRGSYDTGASVSTPVQATELEITANVSCVFNY